VRENLEKLRDFITDLQLVEGTRGLISLFSARQAPAPGKLPAALFPSELPQGADYGKFIETVKTNELIRGKCCRKTARWRWSCCRSSPKWSASSKLSKTIGDIRKLMAEDLADTGLKAELSGVPVMQLEIPQRGRARRVDLQRPRHSGRLHHRDHLLPQDFVHGGRCVPADHQRFCSRSAASAGPISTSTCS